ncbi:hypothetical protein AXG93_626s1140 [Marchantia polymorpha subsp. ruderalis]|uniref:F-box domain-containing protein n=1 Tax=Marchantia polymorpha subsp. ruderalis TaxID=1480154 RepID=A0A176VZR3_MARPO|nr:hypothetical protein AXG93_626s1140 [Marchantia polymorpha subsp. ruderalis]
MEATMESDSDEKASSSEPGEPISDSMRKSLPGDVLLIVLRKLPLQSLRRFRCVCREWNDLCMSWESSISLCLKPGKLVPLYMGHGALSLSDTSTRCWVPCHLEFGEDEEYELVASGGGLLVFLVKPPLDDYCQMEFPTFIVSNPWTRQFLRLPTSFASGSRSLAIPEGSMGDKGGKGRFYWMVSESEFSHLDMLFTYDVKLDYWYLSGQYGMEKIISRCMEHKGEVLLVGRDNRDGSSGKELCFYEIVEYPAEQVQP